MVQVNLAKAKSSFSEYASRAAYTNEHIIITKRGKPFKAGAPEDGLLGAVGMAPELEEVAEKAMEEYQRRANGFGREVEI